MEYDRNGSDLSDFLSRLKILKQIEKPLYTTCHKNRS